MFSIELSVGCILFIQHGWG